MWTHFLLCVFRSHHSVVRLCTIRKLCIKSSWSGNTNNVILPGKTEYVRVIIFVIIIIIYYLLLLPLRQLQILVTRHHIMHTSDQINKIHSEDADGAVMMVWQSEKKATFKIVCRAIGFSRSAWSSSSSSPLSLHTAS